MNVMDLRSCLESWPYEAGKNVRVGRGMDGREIILVRLPMGLEQYEVDGRPDGRRVHGAATVLDFHHARIHAADQTRPATVLELTTADCAELFHEAGVFQHRLSIFFRLRDWIRAERDAARNLRLVEFVRQYARCAEDRLQLEPWHPHVTRVHTIARALILLDNKQYRDAWQMAREAVGLPATADDAAPDHGNLAETLLETASNSLTPPPVFHPRGESSFVRQDDFWTIHHQGQTAFLKSTRGLECLAFLLRTPGREFHVSELLATFPEVPVTPPATMAGRFPRGDGDHLAIAGMKSGNPILDTQAKAEYKTRIHDLRQELADAERFSDPGRAADAKDEINAIARHLASAMGLGGRDRRTSSHAERARCAVTKRIKQAIQKIACSLPALGHHLTARIKTGYFCSYNPHPDRPVAWKF